MWTVVFTVIVTYSYYYSVAGPLNLVFEWRAHPAGNEMNPLRIACVRAESYNIFVKTNVTFCLI